MQASLPNPENTKEHTL